MQMICLTYQRTHAANSDITLLDYDLNRPEDSETERKYRRKPSSRNMFSQYSLCVYLLTPNYVPGVRPCNSLVILISLA